MTPRKGETETRTLVRENRGCRVVREETRVHDGRSSRRGPRRGALLVCIEDGVRRMPSVRVCAGRIWRTRPAWLFSCLLAACVVAAALSPLWGAEGTGDPLAIGWVNSDGEAGIEEFTGQEQLEGTALEATGLGVPAEPLDHQLVRLTNGQRVGRGLPPLKAAQELHASSWFHSDWMADHNCFAHNCPGEPDWISRIKNAGYVNYSALGENIAGGYSTASGAITAWMNSDGHRANMLSTSFREAGGGYAYSATAKYHHYWTMDYGARNDAQGHAVYPVVIENEAWSTNSLDVGLYVYGQGWATEMRFRNSDGTWSPWESYRCDKAWTLSASDGTSATVYAQVKRGSTVLERSDTIHLDLPLRIAPGLMVFLSEQGASPTIPESYGLRIDTPYAWTASADQDWIQLSEHSGSGPAAISVHVTDIPHNPQVQQGVITVSALDDSEEAGVTLVVTNDPLECSHVPLASR